MSQKIVAIFLMFLHLWVNSNAQVAGDTLVLVDNLAIRETHSIFFRGLQGKNLPANIYQLMCLHMT